MVSSKARSSMPSSVQHGSTSASAHVARRRSARRPDSSSSATKPGDRAHADHVAARAAQSHWRPNGVRDPRARAEGRVSATTTRPSDVHVRSAGRAARRPGRAAPVAGAATQRGRGLQAVGIGARVQIPGAELGQHRRDERLACSRVWPRPAAAADRRRPTRTPEVPGAHTLWLPG